MKKNYIYSLLFAVTVILFSSCIVDVSTKNDLCLDYLNQYFPNENFTYIKKKKVKTGIVKNTTYVYYHAENLGKDITVKFLENNPVLSSDQWEFDYESNYQALYFEQQEIDYYKEYLNELFSESKIVFNNAERFLKDYEIEYWIYNEDGINHISWTDMVIALKIIWEILENFSIKMFVIL